MKPNWNVQKRRQENARKGGEEGGENLFLLFQTARECTRQIATPARATQSINIHPQPQLSSGSTVQRFAALPVCMASCGGTAGLAVAASRRKAPDWEGMEAEPCKACLEGGGARSTLLFPPGQKHHDF